MNRKCLILLLLLIVTVLQAQHRDRRASLGYCGAPNFSISATGKLWMSTRLGVICTADHLTPWHEGGKTVAENCQMLCR